VWEWENRAADRLVDSIGRRRFSGSFPAGDGETEALEAGRSFRQDKPQSMPRASITRPADMTSEGTFVQFEIRRPSFSYALR